MTKIDNQIVNVKCEKCGSTPKPGVLLIKAHNLWLCGECFHKHNMKMAKEYKKEMLEG